MRHEKLSPGLLLAYEDYQREGAQGLTTQRRSLGIMASRNAMQQTKSIVFIYCDEDADLRHLLQQGIEVNQNTGSVRTAYLPINSLDPLSEEAVVHRIKPSRKMHLRMDDAKKAVHVPEFQNKTGLTGEKVVIGIVDTGIDAKHPGFNGRILRIWDQTLPGPGVKEGAYGAELSKDQLTISQDTEGHGTHVAGIASAADSTYSGVAPKAELVIVKSDLQDAHIADAVRYIFRIASELKRPAVVNLSLGGHADAHDGSDSLSKIINAETGPGRIVCCAAGNEGNDNIHAQAKVSPSSMSTIRFNVPQNQVGIVWLNGWYSGKGQLEVSVRSPNGFVTPFQKIVTKGNPTQDYQLPDAQVEIATPGPDPMNGDHNFFVQIRGNGTMPVMGGIWQLRIRNTGSTETRLDVWTLDDRSAVFFTGKSVQDAVKIGSPGACKSAITVASYTTKVKYTDIEAKAQEVGLELHSISDFSSEGPLRNDAQKPDVAAPGAMIVSTLSSTAQGFGRSSMINSKFVVSAGTSMATPFVTGLVALLLQRNPKLDPAGVKELLRKNSSIPKKAAGTFDSKWGFGLIDAKNL